MNIKEIQDKKFKLEKYILKLIEDFERETNTSIDELETTKGYIVGSRLPRTMSINIDVKI